jgi:hypothetical protein
MFRRFISLLTACLMAAPFCGCCYASALPAADTEACPACHADADTSAPAPRSSDCPCCTDTLSRQLSPEPAAAPRPVLVVLQAWVRPHSEVWAPATADTPALAHAPQDLPRNRAVPLYLRHCALLH